MTDFKNFLLSAKDITWPDWNKLVSWSYLTDSTVSTDSSTLAALFFFFIALLIVGTAAGFFLARRNRRLPIYGKLRGHLANMTFYLSLVGLLLVLTRYEAIYLFSSRLLLAALFLALIGWGGWIAYYGILVFPKEKKKYLEDKKFRSYLPKKKKK